MNATAAKIATERRRFNVQEVERPDAGGPLYAAVDQHGVEYEGALPSYDKDAVQRRCDCLNEIRIEIRPCRRHRRLLILNLRKNQLTIQVLPPTGRHHAYIAFNSINVTHCSVMLANNGKGDATFIVGREDGMHLNLSHADGLRLAETFGLRVFVAKNS